LFALGVSAPNCASLHGTPAENQMPDCICTLSHHSRNLSQCQRSALDALQDEQSVH